MADLSIFFILDGSGSMSGIQTEVVDGLNHFIQEQKDDAALNGDDVKFSLTVFDYQPNSVYLAEDIALVNPVTKKDTFLGGGTALLDAVGSTLTQVKNKNLPGKKLVVIYTDGYENSSREFSAGQIKNLVDELNADNDWTLIQMGVEVNDYHTASAMGISAGNYMVSSGGGTSATASLRGLSTATIDYKTADYAKASDTFFSDYSNTNLDSVTIWTPEVDNEDEDKGE